MKNRKVALVLSFIYCGLGQIYKGQILKGIDFIIIYTLLILSFVFLRSPFFLYLFNLLIILLMWFLGMVDAYIGDEAFMGRERGLTWQKLMGVISVVIICFAIITLFMSHGQFSPKPNESSVSDAHGQALGKGLGERANAGSSSWKKLEQKGNEEEDSSAASAPAEPGAIPSTTEDGSDTSEFFSVRVGAFIEQKNAEKLNRELLSKGYPARIEQLTFKRVKWHCVMVGRFRSRQEAVPLARQLRRREGLPYVIERCRAADQAFGKGLSETGNAGESAPAETKSRKR